MATDHLRQPAGWSLGGGTGAPTKPVTWMDCVCMDSLSIASLVLDLAWFRA